jgi:hypothetical protein
MAEIQLTPREKRAARRLRTLGAVPEKETVAALKEVQAEIQRVGWNRAIEAAARTIEDALVFTRHERLLLKATAETILKLKK